LANGDLISGELPDLDDSTDEIHLGPKTPSSSRSKDGALQQMELTPQQRKNLKIPPREIAQLKGRRRATLIITPASLIGQWLGQIEMHVQPK